MSLPQASHSLVKQQSATSGSILATREDETCLGESWVKVILATLFRQTIWRLLVVAVPFPDVVRALSPTVTAALVNAVSALGQVKKPTLAHKSFSINDIYMVGFLFCYFHSGLLDCCF